MATPVKDPDSVTADEHAAAVAAPSKSNPSDAEIVRTRRVRTGEILAAQKKVRIRVKDKDQWVQINGYTFYIKKNEWVMVPEAVATLLEDAGHI